MSRQRDALALDDLANAREAKLLGHAGGDKARRVGSRKAGEQLVVLAIAQGVLQRRHTIARGQAARVPMHGDARELEAEPRA